MADFDFLFTEKNLLYIGEKQQKPIDAIWLTDNSHMWFAEDKINAKKYGDFLYTFKPLKPLKLINISSPLFHMDFIGKVNLLYRNNHGFDLRKSLCLMPLGLPSTKEVRRTLAQLGLDSQANFTEDNDEVNQRCSYFNNKHRISININNNNMDNYFVNALKEIYSIKYDGYIQPIQAPSGIFGGKMNTEEICIFKPHTHLKLIKETDISITGGGNRLGKNDIIPNLKSDIDPRWFNMDTITPEMLKEAAPKLDKFGYVIQVGRQ